MLSPDSYRIGLALGGGVARGLAHVGVLTVLERAGIPIHVVAGSSAGAVVGAAYAAGLGVSHIRRTAARIRWLELIRLTWPARGLVSFAGIARRLIAEIGDLEFKDLARPFAVAATDLESGQPVILTAGRVALAVQASCSVPGIIAPVEIDGRILGDGNFSASVPSAAARQLGADFVIGVDIFQPALRKRWGPFGYGFAALEILVQRTGLGQAEADCLITPRLAGKTYLRLSQAQELFALGEAAAQEQLPAIQEALRRFA